ncbi:lytic transglycosylase domain-containing protein [Nocardioides speluncae]|uniref:lytic transglycosylase domain-containing protein n=1 Tax=Nocardioides speluncae TaxID=2670337 RepID=UPI001F0C25CB|nr:lytic murein transglycosylase [Nocardioides speluncae]
MIGWAALVVVLLSGTAALAGQLRSDVAPIPPSNVARLSVAEPSVAGPGGVGGTGGASAGGPRLVADERWARAVAAATGIPVPAMRAYGTATLRLGSEQPGCRLGWTTLAGVGRIESAHGTTDGRRLRDDGTSSPPIIGPALDGRPGFAAIRSTSASMAWHGDDTWDHAVGPMQFIPSTWERWAADGDNDGTADPLDLDDAAYATGRYLCAGDRDLSTGLDWHAAILSYNHSRDYVTDVYDAAVAYAAAG